MGVTHLPPRRQTHLTRKEHNRQLAFCFMASIVLMGILVLVTLAFGQPGADHPFPFKTLEDITTGTPAWVSDGPPDFRMCRGTSVTVAKFQFKSGAESVWVVYTDGVLFSSAYFPPGSDRPIAVVVGHIVDGKGIAVESNVPYDPEKHHPCDPWQKKSASEG